MDTTPTPAAFVAAFEAAPEEMRRKWVRAAFAFYEIAWYGADPKTISVLGASCRQMGKRIMERTNG
jgi:hypothetical protein